jgi:hypothetical protein
MVAPRTIFDCLALDRALDSIGDAERRLTHVHAEARAGTAHCAIAFDVPDANQFADTKSRVAACSRSPENILERVGEPIRGCLRGGRLREMLDHDQAIDVAAQERVQERRVVVE